MQQQEPSTKQQTIEKKGRTLLLFGICALIAGLAIPLVVVFLIKSPQPDEQLFIFGLSYYKLVFVFFICSAIMVHASLFFIRAKPPVILFFFVLLVFCCFPFIFGLKKNLTLNQAIVDIPFFAGWPFFLMPGYVLIEFLIPLGVVAYLYLQVKNFFSKLPHNYAFLCAAVYLSLAAFLGLSGLAQAHLPTIGSAYDFMAKVNFTPISTDTVSQETSPVSFDSEKLNPGQANVVKFSMPSIQTPADEVKIDYQPAPQKDENFSKIFDRLSQRIDGLESQFDTLTQSLKKNEKDLWLSENKEAIVELRREMQRLSDKIDHLYSAPGRMAPPMAAGGGDLNKINEVKSLEKKAAPPTTEVLPRE